MNHIYFEGEAIIIDDQDCVINPLRRYLETIGFQKVHTTNSGEDGFNMIRQEMEHIKIIFLDMLMPGWSGARTFRAIRSLDAHIPVILMSGYLQNHIETYFDMIPGPEAFLQKPFDLEAIQDCLTKALGTVQQAPCGTPPN